MGYDKLIGFLNKNLQNNCYQKIFNIKDGIIVANHVIFDITFIIYLCINYLEEDINNIIKYILSLKYTDHNIVINKINKIISKKYWKKTNLNLDCILEGETEDIIIDLFKKEINKNLNEMISYLLLFKIVELTKSLHNFEFIKSINIFFDGIPSYSKILEQRRRRMKNYTFSRERKELFQKYFIDIDKNVIFEDGIIFDYFNWIDNKFSFNKSIGPFSDITLYIQNFINKNLKLIYPNLKIFIDFSINYGEADFKIFKFIEEKKLDGEIYIHSCDSDFIYFILLFQILKNIKSVNINYNLIRYNLKLENDYQLLQANRIINELLLKYKYINNLIDIPDSNVILDFLFLVFLFGNDVLPTNYEINAELSLKLIFETHNFLFKNKKYIINLKKDNFINFDNFKIWIKNIKDKNSETIIILNKYYKISYNFILLCTEKLNYNINQIIENLIKPYLIYKGSLLKTFDSTDIRCVLYKKNKIKNPENPLNNFSKNIKEEIEKDLNKIFDFTNFDDYGLIKLEKGIELGDNPYQNLYNFTITKCSDKYDKINGIEFKNLKNIDKFLTEIYLDVDVKNYLDNLIIHTLIYFKNFNYYNPFLLFYYKKNNTPSINQIIKYIENNNINLQQLKCLKILKNYKVKNYFSPISHHLFITPYLIDSVFINDIKYIKNIKNVLELIKNKITGIWYEEGNDEFKIRDIDPENFIIVCNNIIQFYNSNLVNNILQNGNLLY